MWNCPRQHLMLLLSNWRSGKYNSCRSYALQLDNSRKTQEPSPKEKLQISTIETHSNISNTSQVGTRNQTNSTYLQNPSTVQVVQERY
ncbi:hypothetical protein Avbf_19016 [Armadillidium vulgare]|nr:hypothetical protein Avbf_19016 [Armadillidium vulgare]